MPAVRARDDGDHGTKMKRRAADCGELCEAARIVASNELERCSEFSADSNLIALAQQRELTGKYLKK